MRILAATLLTMSLSGFAADKTYSTAWTKHFGGSDFDGVTATATDSDGSIYVGGSTSSVDLPANGAFRSPASSNLRRFPAGANRVEVVRGPVAGEVLAMTTVGAALYVATRSGIMLTRDRGATWLVLDMNIARQGLVTGMAVEPGNPAVIYVAAQSGGLWKTSDGGKTWTVLAQGGDFQGQTTYINHVYIDPWRTSTVYALGASKYIAFRSDDQGATWTRLPDFLTSIAFDVERPGVIYASQRDIVLISEDNGQSWSELASPSHGWIEELTADPMRPGVLYLRDGSAIYRSTDRGRAWVRLALPSGVIAPDPGSPTLYAFANGALLKSNDAGDSWTTLARDVFPYGRVLTVLQGSVFIGGAYEQESFVAKFSSAGDLVWATYVPAVGVSAIAAGKDSSVYITGYCSTTLAALGGMPCSVYASTYVAKFTSDGQKLAYAKEFSTNAYITSIAVDSAGSAHIAGVATGAIPTTPGALEPDPGDIPPPGLGATDGPIRGFAAKFTAGGTTLLYSTYLGDWRSLYPWSYKPGDYVSSIVVDTAGNAIAVGTAIWKINPTGTRLLYSTRLDGPLGAASLDSQDNLYVAGTGIGKQVYTTAGAFRTDGSDKQEVFIAKLNPSGDILVATLVGPGSATDLAVGPDGPVLVGGRMEDRQFPKKSLLEVEGINFVAQFDTALSALQFSTPVDLGTSFKMGIVQQRDAGLVIATAIVNPPSNLGQSPDSDVVLRGIKPMDSPVRVDSLANAASLAAAPLAPGELIVIQGNGFGTEPRVTAGDLEFSVVQSSDTILWVMVPDSVQPHTQRQLTVEANGGKSEGIQVRFAEFSSAIFTADGSGEGQALALNEDGTLNAATNPAARGSILAIALNGLGKLQEIGSSVVPGSQLSIYFDNAYAYGVDANLLQAPGIPAEVVFVKVYVPKDYPFSSQPIPRAVALWVTPNAGSLNRASVWIK